MKEKVKNLVGFIQIPILISIIVGMLVLGGGGYLGVKQYKEQKIQNIEKQKITTEKEQETKSILENQQKQLEEAQQKIEELNRNSELNKEKAQAQINQLQQELSHPKSPSVITESIQNNQIDINKLLKTVVMIACITGYEKYSIGSGTIIHSVGTIITNAHVVGNEKECLIGITINESDPPTFKYVANVKSVLSVDDLALLRIIKTTDGSDLPSSFDYLDYPSCEKTKTPQINDKIYIAGYPGIGQNTFTLTDGIISGSVKPWHFKTSAKIDEGNSGGAAINEKGQLIGVPTYGVVGELESLGYIINLLGGAASCN